ncbi:MAG: hypothetical protein QG670_313 [Thermoproteota archaeon]|nr:hypothetical protein [Thermoproteota archaeon]
MTDPPSNWGPAEAIYITFNNIMIHRADAGDESGWISTDVSGVNMSLLEIVDVNKTVGQTFLQASLYNVGRFNITKAIVTYSGINDKAVVESGQVNVPIVPGGVRVTAGQTTSILIDLVPRVTGSVGSFKLTPAAHATLAQAN